MAYVTHTEGALARPSILSGLKANLVQRFEQYRAYRSTVSALAMLTDRELNDLGISRADIRSIAEDAAYGA